MLDPSPLQLVFPGPRPVANGSPLKILRCIKRSLQTVLFKPLKRGLQNGTILTIHLEGPGVYFLCLFWLPVQPVQLPPVQRLPRISPDLSRWRLLIRRKMCCASASMRCLLGIASFRFSMLNLFKFAPGFVWREISRKDFLHDDWGYLSCSRHSQITGGLFTAMMILHC